MVALMLPVLVGLGVWQLQRAEWKEAMLADLAANSARPVAAPAPGAPLSGYRFRRVVLLLACEPPPPVVSAGRSLAGQPGYAVLVPCRRADPIDDPDSRVLLAIGWGPRPDSWKAASAAWPPAAGHRVEGVLVERSGEPRWLLVARAAAAPLEPSAPPTPETIPNNHRSYAIQWFSFAGILAIVYAAFVRRWRRNLAAAPPGR